MSAVERFMPLITEAEDENLTPTPCMTHDGINVRLWPGAC